MKTKNLIRRRKIKYSNFDLLVIRVDKNLNLRESSPCYHCTRELEKNCKTRNFNIDKIYYSTSEGNIDCIKFTEYTKKEHKISSGYRNYNK